MVTASILDAVPLAEAASFFPGKPHVATLWRWAKNGVRGVRLETVVVGGRRMVTPAAIESFLSTLNRTASEKSNV